MEEVNCDHKNNLSIWIKYLCKKIGEGIILSDNVDKGYIFSTKFIVAFCGNIGVAAGDCILDFEREVISIYPNIIPHIIFIWPKYIFGPYKYAVI